METNQTETNNQKPLSRKTKIVLGSVGALAILFMVGASTFTLAASTSTASSFLDRVAQIVGIDSTKLKSALQQASTESIDQKLAAGEITQEQADNMKEHIEDGNYFGGMRGDRLKGGPGIMVDREALASFLGLTTDELRTKEDENKTLLEIATAQGKTENDLKTFLSTKFDENLATAVSEGKITQTQADSMKSKKDDMISSMITNTRPQGGRGMRGRPDSDGQY